MTMDPPDMLLQLFKREINQFLIQEIKLDEINRSFLDRIITHFPGTDPINEAGIPIMALSTAGLRSIDLFSALTQKLDNCVSSTRKCMRAFLITSSYITLINNANQHLRPILIQSRMHYAKIIKRTLLQFLIRQEFLIRSIRYLFVRIVTELFPDRLDRILDMPIDIRGNRIQVANPTIKPERRNNHMLDLNDLIRQIIRNMDSIKHLAVSYKQIFSSFNTLLGAVTAPTVTD